MYTLNALRAPLPLPQVAPHPRSAAPTQRQPSPPSIHNGEPSRAPSLLGAPNVTVEHTAGAVLRGVGCAAQRRPCRGRPLSFARSQRRLRCSPAARPARFSSFRNLHIYAAGEAELRAAPLPTLALPATPKRLSGDLTTANPWPPV